MSAGAGECHGQTPRHGSPNKTRSSPRWPRPTTVIPSLSARASSKASASDESAAGIKKFGLPNSIVVSDGLRCFRGLTAAGAVT